MSFSFFKKAKEEKTTLQCVWDVGRVLEGTQYGSTGRRSYEDLENGINEFRSMTLENQTTPRPRGKF